MMVCSPLAPPSLSYEPVLESIADELAEEALED